jgi:hypothetical protein
VILRDIWDILSEIEEAKRINNSIMLFSDEAFTVHNSSKLSEAISNLQSYSERLRSECIKLLRENIDLEKKLKNFDADIPDAVVCHDLN